MEEWAEIRRLRFSERMGVKAIALQLGVSKKTVRNACALDGTAPLPAGTEADGRGLRRGTGWLERRSEHAYTVGRIQGLLNFLGDPEVGRDIGRMQQLVRRRGDDVARQDGSSVLTRASPLRQLQRRLDADAEVEVVQGYLAGSTVYELAEHHEIHSRRGHRGQGLTQDQTELAIRLYRQGWSLAKIGGAF